MAQADDAGAASAADQRDAELMAGTSMAPSAESALAVSVVVMLRGALRRRRERRSAE
jgi:hypothetical protein